MIECISTQEKYTCLTNISNLVILSDTNKDNGGSGQGIRPHDLLATALASCLNITARIICDKLKIPYQYVVVNVELQKEMHHTVFLYDIKFDSSISLKDKELIIEAIRNCPVKETLSKPISILKSTL